MASDITLAVGDGARRMTYAELAAVRGISVLSAERLVRRRHWPRQMGNDGVVRVLVPLTEARKVGGKSQVSGPGYPPRTDRPDIRGVIREVIREMAGATSPDIREDDREDIRAIESANAALRETITAHEVTIADLRQRLDLTDGERRQISEERRELLVALADARTAAMISGSEAAGLRAQLEARGRRWWQRWRHRRMITLTNEPGTREHRNAHR
jgi:hypothetical protein